MKFSPTLLKEKAKKAETSTKEFFKKIKKKEPAHFDQVVHTIHDEVFVYTDCLSCGNCCKTLGPRMTHKDIDKLSKHLKIKPSEFVSFYLKIDEDKDYVLKSLPCPFLGEDNYCSVYENRPKACKEYPHTDRKKFSQILDITAKNTYTCPAVYEIIEKLKTRKF